MLLREEFHFFTDVGGSSGSSERVGLSPRKKKVLCSESHDAIQEGRTGWPESLKNRDSYISTQFVKPSEGLPCEGAF